MSSLLSLLTHCNNNNTKTLQIYQLKVSQTLISDKFSYYKISRVQLSSCETAGAAVSQELVKPLKLRIYFSITNE